jgi:hypothetical protein
MGLETLYDVLTSKEMGYITDLKLEEEFYRLRYLLYFYST